MHKRIRQYSQSIRYLMSMVKGRLLSHEERINISSKPGIICLQPFYFMEFTPSGKVYTCCPGWVKFSIGNIKKKTISEIWNSPRARYIRSKMYRGEWQEICNPICPHIAVYKQSRNVILLDYLNRFDFMTSLLISEVREGKCHLDSFPTVFNLSNSKVCNLSCIMCYRVLERDNPTLIEKTAKDIATYLPAARKLVLTGMGDPLARPDTRRLLINFKNENPDLSFDIITNALLLPKYWAQIKHQRFGALLVSVDAATQQTYEKIRIGGSWDTLLKSLSLIKENKAKFSSVTINMTVMRNNYKEIPDFIDFAELYGFDVSFQRIRGKWGMQNIFEMDDASALNELKSIVKTEQAKQRDINVFWGDLYFNAACENM